MKFTLLFTIMSVVSGVDMVIDKECYSSDIYDPSIGSWVQTENGVEDSPAILSKRGQSCRFSWDEKHKEPQPYWKWEPDNCVLHDVNSVKFCHVMKHRKGILLVGDSLTQLMTNTLVAVANATLVYRTHDGASLWHACNGDLPIQSVRNDYLDIRNTTGRCVYLDGTNGSQSTCSEFADDDTLGRFDTLVVNSGAHLRDFDEFGNEMDVAAKYLSEKMRILHGDSAIYIARNTPPGHWDCETRTFEGPVEKDVAESLVAESPKSYGWATFEENNIAFENAFSRERGWLFMDAFTPTLLRPDSHIGNGDCLHYCIPGPVDHWVTLLYNILHKIVNK